MTANHPYAPVPDPGPEVRSYRDLAECRGSDPAQFEEARAGESTGVSNARIAVARAICRRCPVTVPCLGEGVTTRQSGVWGGVLLNNGIPDEVKRRTKLCGSLDGYNEHRRRRDAVCAPCRAAYEEAKAVTRRARSDRDYPCSTSAAARRHTRAGNRACEPCRNAESRRKADAKTRNVA